MCSIQGPTYGLQMHAHGIYWPFCGLIGDLDFEIWNQIMSPDPLPLDEWVWF